MHADPRTDEALLAATRRTPAAFGTFYRRHARDVLAYLVTRVRDPEVAADLMAEVFASALRDVERFDPGRGPAVAWLYGIARHKMLDAIRSGAVDDRIRRQLRMSPILLSDDALERVEALASLHVSAADLAEALQDLPADQRDALRERVMHDRSYAEIARDIQTSPSVVRQRVSRGLAALRARLDVKP